jgi:hypothetical protein
MILFFLVIMVCLLSGTMQGMEYAENAQIALMAWRMHNIRVIERPLSKFPGMDHGHCLEFLKKHSHVHHFSFYDAQTHSFYIKRSCHYTCIDGQGCEREGDSIQENFDCYHVQTTDMSLGLVPFIESFSQEISSHGAWYDRDYTNNIIESNALQTIKNYLPVKSEWSYNDTIMSNDFLCIVCVQLNKGDEYIVIFEPHKIHFLGGRIKEKLSDCCMYFQ